jgi:GTPase SAR1 family protein
MQRKQQQHDDEVITMKNNNKNTRLELEEGWLLQSDVGISLLNHLSKEASKRASQFKFGNPSHATPHTNEMISARIDISLKQPSCVMGILSRYHNTNLEMKMMESSSSILVNQSFWNHMKPQYNWNVRLHGDSMTGKTAMSMALCRSSSNGNSGSSGTQQAQASDTPGLVIRETLVPIKFVSDNHTIRWVRLEIEDVGSQQEVKYNYLKYSSNNATRSFDIHIVVLSMTDSNSMENAKETIRWLIDTCNVDRLRILAVATKVDEFQSYQITDTDLQEFVSNLNVSLCLVNNHAQFGEEHSVYVIVEELARIMLLS